MTTEQKHEISIPGLPEGYRLVRVDIKQNDRYRNGDGTSTIVGCEIVIKKIKPRRIVLEETDEDNVESNQHGVAWRGQYFGDHNQVCVLSPKIWRQAREE